MPKEGRVSKSSKRKSKKLISSEPFVIRIINAMIDKHTKLTVSKQSTLKEIQETYTAFEKNPEKYNWQDMYGNNLELEKNVIENNLVGEDETVEFDGLQKEPCIILVFKDGFEDDRPYSLNPTRGPPDVSRGLCRNY